MGFFKKLVDILFGTQKEYAVKDLGIFHSKVCDWWQNEHYNWWSTIQLPLYSTETVIWIEGDAQAPLSQHIGFTGIVEELGISDCQSGKFITH